MGVFLLESLYLKGKNLWLLYDEVLSWDWKDNDTSEVFSPVPENIVAVLGGVITAFGQCYGVEYISTLKACVLPCGNEPISYRGMNLIGITARGRDWKRYAYEFAHELCHLTIPGAVAQSFRWFEESLCELASVFFMYEMAKVWAISPPYPNWKDYASELSKHSDKVINEKPMQIPSNLTFSKFFEEKMEFLSTHCYERDVNCLCAKHLLPIFTETPSLWQDVPTLVKWKQGTNFMDALIQWKEEANAKEAIEKIIRLFYPC